jgi:hypothetical protein
MLLGFWAGDVKTAQKKKLLMSELQFASLFRLFEKGIIMYTPQGKRHFKFLLAFLSQHKLHNLIGE